MCPTVCVPHCLCAPLSVCPTVCLSMMVDSSVSLLAVVVLHSEPYLGEKRHCACDQGNATLVSHDGLPKDFPSPLLSSPSPPFLSSPSIPPPFSPSSPLFQVCHEDVRKILHTVSVQRPAQGWEFKLPNDQEFCNKSSFICSVPLLFLKFCSLTSIP